jgi:hypothetical protein
MGTGMTGIENHQIGKPVSVQICRTAFIAALEWNSPIPLGIKTILATPIQMEWYGLVQIPSNTVAEQNARGHTVLRWNACDIQGTGSSKAVLAWHELSFSIPEINNRLTLVGLFAAVSYDEGKTWPERRLVTPGNTAKADTNGYLAIIQTRDGCIQLITSSRHYAFNLAWLKQLPEMPKQ